MKALVLAGGLPQIELLQQLKKRNIVTVLADGGSNPIARPYADAFCRINILDPDAVRELALREKVDFILTVCADQVLLIMAQVSEQLGLPCYIDYKTAQDVSDKLRMKRIFRENGIPTSDYVRLDRLERQAIQHLRFPLVVKPVDAYSSKGVRKVTNEAELAEYYEQAAQISRSGDVILEEYCEGFELSVDVFVSGGRARVLCVSQSEKILDDNRFVIFRGRTPIALSDAVRREIEQVAQKITDAFELKNAPMLIQMICDGEHISVLEFCARTGGNMKWLMIKYACGVDVITAAIDLTLGIKPSVEPHNTGNALVVNDFLYCKPGVYDRVEGFEELAADGIIHEYHVLRPQGMQVQGVRSSSDRIAGVCFLADSVADYNRKRLEFLEKARILDVNGQDILRHDLLPELR